MSWTEGVPLRVGEEVEERTRLVGATAKRSRDGSEMVLVEVDKEFWGLKGLALVDRRSWVFRPPPKEALARTEESVAGTVPGAVGKYSSAEDVKIDDSGQLQPPMCVDDELSVLNFQRNSPAPVQLVTSGALPILSINIQRPHDTLQRKLDAKH